LLRCDLLWPCGHSSGSRIRGTCGSNLWNNRLGVSVSGTRYTRAGYPSDLLHRSNRCPKKCLPLLIGLGSRLLFGRFVMPSRNESARALARLQLETPISNDANLLNLQKQVEDFVREARRRDPSEPNELVSTVVDTVARDYFRHAILKQRRLASLKGAGS
jgi:hypothetical protein